MHYRHAKGKHGEMVTKTICTLIICLTETCKLKASGKWKVLPTCTRKWSLYPCALIHAEVC